MGYCEAAGERAMKIQEVVLRALSGEIHWFQAAEILGVSMRTMRRYRWGLDKWGYEGLFDRRRRSPSPRSIPVESANSRRVHSYHRPPQRRIFNESGQITCQKQAVNSLVNHMAP
jgi:hypothetical protein